MNGTTQKTGYRLRSGDILTIAIPTPPIASIEPENLAFDKLFEDTELLVLSKPPGLVVHPSAGHYSGTLVHGLLYHCTGLSGASDKERPGIVHRLDRDTSGVMVVAKTDTTHRFLTKQFKERKVKKTYRAILDGIPPTSEGKIEHPIGRHPVNRKKMAVLRDGGRHAVTTWKILETFAGKFASVELGLETGRTHQIRVHMATMGHPVAGDPVYGKKKKEHERLGISRQCLHSFSLSFAHPVTKAWLSFCAPLWPDMERIILTLRAEEHTEKLQESPCS